MDNTSKDIHCMVAASGSISEEKAAGNENRNCVWCIKITTTLKANMTKIHQSVSVFACAHVKLKLLGMLNTHINCSGSDWNNNVCDLLF